MEPSKKQTRTPRVYVAGPLNALAVGYIQNMHEMMTWAETLRLRGYSVFVPALDFLMGLKFGYDRYEQYFDNSQPWLDVADAVFLCPGWEESAGTKREIERAKERGIPVFESIMAISAWRAESGEELNRGCPKDNV